MSRKVQTVAPAPVYFACSEGRFPLVNRWSGREDSNLRPLPPERVSPSGTRCFLEVFSGGPMRSDGRCSFPVPGARFTANLNPCLYGATT
jgi:hypothetical protein